MAKNPIAGISGILGGLISSAPPAPALADQSPAPAAGPTVEEQTATRPMPRGTGARRGRPPGRLAAPAIRREKVTLRIDARLIDDYRDWSWTQRCQLGELVERALSSYRKSR
jgi:hypothetical protein